MSPMATTRAKLIHTLGLWAWSTGEHRPIGNVSDVLDGEDHRRDREQRQVPDREHGPERRGQMDCEVWQGPRPPAHGPGEAGNHQEHHIGQARDAHHRYRRHSEISGRAPVAVAARKRRSSRAMGIDRHRREARGQR